MRTTRARTGRGRRRGSWSVAVGAALTLTLTLTACGPEDDSAGGDDGGKPVASESSAGEHKIRIPDGVRDRLKEHGIDLGKWENGAWRKWDKDTWLRKAEDYVNPIIDGLWDPDRMRRAEDPQKKVDDGDLADDRGVTDPAPAPVEAAAVTPPYHDALPEAGKVLFDSPEGSMVCSATVVEDPAHPGKSNLVWTAGHCVHAGRKGGWYRNIAFVPAYNNAGKPTAELEKATREEIAPYGVWWSDWAQTSKEWIASGGPTGGAGAPYDFAVLHVTPENGGGKSLEETVGGALPVDFAAPSAAKTASLTASGYPAAPPFDGQALYQCPAKPGRLSLGPEQPTMYRIGCTMTGGASGGGWVGRNADGEPALVSNTSIGPVRGGWLAGPRLGKEAEDVYRAVSDKADSLS
ncbi:MULTISPECIES: hypothetical protein [unclassified Streptomyces]|uniref:trypsin-like serine peptidase n=1 Tax=unclassified Streptomyces TaxID=2593676 RepID=UPI00081EA26F|nr:MULTISPECIES: hypothetical protein [unclassified Streptomyces]SCE73381.1 hypothetical protein GA0115257_101646 [Streptomyces sp. LcepLS]